MCKRCQWADRELALEVNRVGININQIRRRAHLEGIASVVAELGPVLAELKMVQKLIVDTYDGGSGN